MIHYEESEVLRLFEDPVFLQGYEDYQQSHTELQGFRSFIDSIEFNKGYFRLAMGKQGPRHKQRRNLGADTIAIKEINSYLNKLTERTLEKITMEIQSRLVGREYLQHMILETLVDKALLYPQYIPVYLTVLRDLYPGPEIYPVFVRCIDTVFEKVLQAEIGSTQSEYLQFCDKNKRLDKVIGHSLLLAECEKRGIVKDKIHPTLESLLTILGETTDNDEKYKGVQCVYTILKSLYPKQTLPPHYHHTIQTLIHQETSPKIKYKLMDIVERR